MLKVEDTIAFLGENCKYRDYINKRLAKGQKNPSNTLFEGFLAVGMPGIPACRQAGNRGHFKTRCTLCIQINFYGGHAWNRTGDLVIISDAL